MMGVMIQAAFLVMIVLVVRKVFGTKLHIYVRYGLWLIVALRLLVPVNLIDSPFSMLRVTGIVAERLTQDGLEKTEQEEAGQSLIDSSSLAVNWQTDEGQPFTGENVMAVNGDTSTNDDERQETDGVTSEIGRAADSIGSLAASGSSNLDSTVSPTGEDFQTDHRILIQRMIVRAIRAIWLIGVLLVGGFLGVTHYRFRRNLFRKREVWKAGPSHTILQMTENCRLPVYRVEKLESPCLVGLFSPAIYIGADIPTDAAEFQYIIVHEETHYLHGDHIWALLRAVLVSVYWFHPFVWIAAAASARDGELACDHGTVKRLGQEERFAYGEMILNLSGCGGRRGIYSYGTMLWSGRSELRERVLQLTETGGSRRFVGIVAAFLMLVAAGCAFTGAASGDERNGAASYMESEDTFAGEIVKEGDTTPPESEEGNLPGGGSEDVGDGGGESLGDVPEQSRQVTAQSAKITEDTPFGADGPCLDYAGNMMPDGDSIIIFHDYFGLIVYDLRNREVVRSLDLAAIGCDKTQGDDACQVAVSEDGGTVWLHPRSKRYMYRYEVGDDLLWQEPLVKTFEIDLEGKTLYDHYIVSEDVTQKYKGWRSNYLYEEYADEQGIHNAYIYLYVSEERELCLGSLNCTWDDMEFMLFWQNPPGIGDDPTAEVKGFSDTYGETEKFPYNYEGVVEQLRIIYDVPCDYSWIANTYVTRIHPVTGEEQSHAGIDYAAEEGTDIVAAADGVVYETGYSDTYGNYVVLLHSNGEMTYYCQCLKVIVGKDEQVKRGQKIAAVGSTGRSTGSHLHFALSENGEFVNPEEYMRDGSGSDAAD